MITGIFKKTIFISLLGHLTAFSFLSFSFDRQLPNLSHTRVAFWGDMLKPYDLISNKRMISKTEMNKPFAPLTQVLVPLKQLDRGSYPLEANYLKPYVRLTLESQKQVFMNSVTKSSLPVRKKGQVVMLYPQLPYHFNLYFKDRQVAHIELEYSIVSKDKSDAIWIRRKISSGNLEVDLLCMRYINLFLSMQHDRFMPNKWQTVKIDLEPKK